MSCINPQDPRFQEILTRIPNRLLAELEYDRLYNPKQGNLFESTPILQEPNSDYLWARYSDNNYEVSSVGDKRFSALYAKLKDGRTIEEAYQLDIKGYRSRGNDWKLGKGKPPIKEITKEQQWEEYKNLWRTYLSENPDLLEELRIKATGKVLTDRFASTDISQARALAEILNESQEGKQSPVLFEEEPTSGYRNRTIKNASADATIAIAIDFNSAGEKLTKSTVIQQGKKYIPIDLNKPEITDERVNRIVQELNNVGARTLNIAGNGIYTMKGKYTQEQVDNFTYELLKRVVEHPDLKNPIESIRSGGQTGLDEAGIKAAIRLGIPARILAPKGWLFRDKSGRDIADEKQFKSRFYQTETQSEQPSDETIDRKIQSFLEKIGVSVHSVRNIRDRDGNIVPAIAVADILNKTIQVVEGRADLSTLPEEAATFFIEMLGDHHPLLKEMMGKITGYKIYSDTVQQYKGRKEYRNEDGTVNFDKIKKEAITKLVAYHIIKLEKGSESDLKLSAAMKWWHKLWEWIKNLFSKAEDNPFEQVAGSILTSDISELSEATSGDIYYQLDGSLRDLDADQEKIKLDNTIDERTGQKRHIYYYDGVQAKGSVTTVYVDRWLKQKFKNRPDSRSEAQKQLDLLKAEFGDGIHEEFQNVVKSLTNPDGSLREAQAPIAPVTNKAIFDQVNAYVQELFSQYPEGTIFKSEVKIFDKKTRIAGSIDLMIISPDGTVDIYDWKSQEISKGQRDIKSYKEPMYRIQLENYRNILEYQYGFKKFGKVRAIPIRTMLEVTGSKTTLKNIEIGSLDPDLIPDDKAYLLPVTLREESTGSKDMDLLLEKLYGIYDKIERKKQKGEDYQRQREELSRLRLALRDLHPRGRIERLIEVGFLEYRKYEQLVENKTLSGKDIEDAIKILTVFSESGTLLASLMEEAMEAAKAHSEAAYEQYRNMVTKFNSMTSNVSSLIRRIEQYRENQAVRLGEENGISNVLEPEKPVGTLAGWFSALSNLKQSSFRLFSKLLRKTQHQRDTKVNEMISDLTELKKKFAEWAGSKGISETKGLEMILNIDENGNWNGNFLNKYSPEFYRQKEEALKKADLKWLADNFTFDEEKYQEAEKRQLEFYKSIQYALDEAENQKIIERKMLDWITSYKVVKENGEVNQTALLNPNNHFLIPKETWLSEKWKELNKPDNKPLLDVYNYFQGMLKYAQKLGMIEKFTGSFIPSMYKSKMDHLVFGDVNQIFSGNGLFESLQIDNDVRFAPETDPTDGSIINRIPVYFTQDIGVEREDGTKDFSKKSRDLFKVFGIWGAHMYNYEAMQAIEDDSLILLQVEQNKNRLKTDQYDEVIYKNGKVQAIKDNDRNAKLLEGFVNYYLYDRLGGVDKDRKFKVAGKEYSLMRSVRAASRFFAFKTLALNPVSGTANFVGGYGNALFTAQKGIFFNKKDWAKALYLSVSDKKTWAALDFFDVLIEERRSQKINNLSLSTTNKIINEDSGYIIQRLGDKAVQNPIAIAVLMNHMVDEQGQIVDIETHVKAKYDYNNTFYDLSDSDRKALRSKIDKEVGELKETRSILSVGTVDEKGKFQIPGIEQSDEQIGLLRDKIKAISKRIIGNASRDDINSIRTTMFGMALMQFRSWMPEMVEDRFAGLKYHDSLGTYTYGKVKLFLEEAFSKRFPLLVKALFTGFGDSGIKAAKEKYQLLKRDALEKGEDFEITEGEFIDLYKANLRSELLELTTIISFFSMLFSLSAASDDDEDEEIKGYKKYLARMFAKYEQEFTFYYDPTEFTKMIKSPIPLIGLLEDFFRFSSNIFKEIFGQVFDEELAEKAKPLKYFFRMVPVAKEAMLWMASVDADFRKEWDIKITY